VVTWRAGSPEVLAEAGQRARPKDLLHPLTLVSIIPRKGAELLLCSALRT
jgi:hypothetical protein